LGAWRYDPKTVTLHRDPTAVHADRRLWGSWNVVTRHGDMTVTYYLNRVQSLRTPVDYFVTLGDRLPLGAIVRQTTYRHPVFDRASVASQPEIRRLGGENRTHFCGAYLGHGFHEDGVVSALEVARRYGLGLQAEKRLAAAP
jgi:predicted NAD/FAD-binding protein